MKKILLAVLALALMLCGCDSDDASYKKGTADYEETITAINLQWTDGEVDIVYGDQDFISLYEDAARELTKDEKVRSKIVDGVLYIKYSKDNASAPEAHKLLTITLPSNTQLDSFICDNTSGTIVLYQVAITEKIEYSGGAGIFEANLISDIQQISADCESTAISLTTNKVDSISVKSTDSYSNLYLNDLPKQMRIEGEKGEVCVWCRDVNISFAMPNTEIEIFSDLQYQVADNAIVFGNGRKIYTIAIPQPVLRVFQITDEQ